MPILSEKRKAAYGSWASPLSAERLFARNTELRRGLGRMVVDGDDLFWIEGRPNESGRNVVCRRDGDGSVSDASPPGVSVRTRVHEYGGGDFTVADGTLFYSDDTDGRVYASSPRAAAAPRALSPADTGDHFADFVFDRKRSRLLCVRERPVPGKEPRNEFVAIATDGSNVTVLAGGADFYASAALSPDGDALAWIQWNHPNMPWDGCELWLASLDAAGLPTDAKRIAGGSKESIFQPAWSPNGILYFVSDRSDWWNLYRFDSDGTRIVCPRTAEMALPQWQFGESTYGFVSPDEVLAASTCDGAWKLARISLATGEFRELSVPHTDIGHLRVDGGKAYYRGSSPTLPAALVEFDLDTGITRDVYCPESVTLDPEDVAVPEAVTFPTTDDAIAHAFYYAPGNAAYEGPADAKPPLIVVGHGGPTAAASTALDLKIQFWTTRGFAVLDVNYRGSTGYGRAYRSALEGQWGIVDVEDCVAGARFLVEQGRVDANGLAIRGSSAGGFTVLCALTFHDVFRAGACYYGISDLEALVRDTHKFEAHYTDSLVGPYPEQASLYRERSPIHFVDRLSCPLIVLQGLQDKVVPPSQAEAVVEALRGKKLPVAYVTFADEGHGFRDARNGRIALEAELSFYAQVFGFTPADELAPLKVENLQDR